MFNSVAKKGPYPPPADVDRQPTSKDPQPGTPGQPGICAEMMLKKAIFIKNNHSLL